MKKLMCALLLIVASVSAWTVAQDNTTNEIYLSYEEMETLETGMFVRYYPGSNQFIFMVDNKHGSVGDIRQATIKVYMDGNYEGSQTTWSATSIITNTETKYSVNTNRNQTIIPIFYNTTKDFFIEFVLPDGQTERYYVSHSQFKAAIDWYKINA